jgi:hypothetical protein
MAKGSSKSTADVYGRSGGCVGEYRRSAKPLSIPKFRDLGVVLAG